jgi:hypothetical protein
VLDFGIKHKRLTKGLDKYGLVVNKLCKLEDEAIRLEAIDCLNKLKSIVPTLLFNALQFVDEEFNAAGSSGLSGLANDCILNVIRELVTCEGGDDSIKNIVGLSKRTANIMKHGSFEWALERAKKWKVSYMPDPTDAVTIRGSDISLNDGNYVCSPIVNKEIKSGIYKLTYKMHTKANSNYFGLGVIAKSALVSLNSSVNYIGQFPGSACLWSIIGGNFCYIAKGGKNIGTSPLFVANDGDEVSEELNMDRGTVHYFINGNLIPHYIHKIPPVPVYMGIGLIEAGVGATLVALEDLRVSSVDRNINCKCYPWK